MTSFCFLAAHNIFCTAAPQRKQKSSACLLLAQSLPDVRWHFQISRGDPEIRLKIGTFDWSKNAEIGRVREDDR